MKVYLVGGAVRDQLLGLPIKERDWVVVGAEPDTLLNLNYRQVGRGFPVFLHPETQEEYALARTEKKLGAGYYGFTCDTNSKVTLEEDLARRDLTINAMAMDSDGHPSILIRGNKIFAANYYAMFRRLLWKILCGYYELLALWRGYNRWGLNWHLKHVF